MAASYPGAIKSFTTKTNNVDDVDAAHINDIQDEIEAIETALGADLEEIAFVEETEATDSSDRSTTSTSYVDVTNMAVSSFTHQGGLVIVSVRLRGDSAGQPGVVAVCDGSNNVKCEASGSNAYQQPISFTAVFVMSAGSQTVKLRFKSPSGDNFHIKGSVFESKMKVVHQ